MKTSEIIRNIMLENKLSQAQLANMIGVSQKAVSNWLNGIDNPNSSSLLFIYKNFGITPNELLEIDSKEMNNTLPQYTADEQMLIRTYRSMSEGKKRALFQMLDLDEDVISKKKA